MTIFLSAFLLFQVQLIVAKHLLPWFGGTPAVWTTCQLFFQVTLLAGYAYAHLLGRKHELRQQGWIHIMVLAAAVAALVAGSVWSGLPLLAPEVMRPGGIEQPVLQLLLILVVTVGLPFLVLAATGPLLQRWHSHTSGSLDRTYRLYALSNAGSLLGLVSYPMGIERLLDLGRQAGMWSGLFVVFAGGCATVAWRATRIAAGVRAATESERLTSAGGGDGVSGSPRWLQPWFWLLLSFSSSAMFLSTTNELSLEVAAVPFLWVIPLGLYLLTFIICFDRPRWYSRRWFLLGAALITAVVLALSIVRALLPIPLLVLAYGLFLASFCMVCHGELARLRPDATRLTQFYLVIATGGALGGAFVGLIAPAFFPAVWEFHVGLLVGWTVFGAVWTADRKSSFYTGDRWSFALATFLVSIPAVHFSILWGDLHQTALVARHGWKVPLVVGAAASVLVSLSLWRTRLAAARVWPLLLVVFVLLTGGNVLDQRIDRSQRSSEFAARDFYGVVRVRVEGVSPYAMGVKVLYDGNTIHGVQLVDPDQRNLPTAYYSPSAGISAAVRYQAQARTLREPGSRGGVHFGILGMGAGAMAGFARAGDQVRYYELNPTVIEISAGSDPHFSFLRDCAGEVTVVAGDGRLSLERELRQIGSMQFDLLAMDAFTSDAVPVHLLTEEAFRVYAAHLRDDNAILAFNVTNRHFDLEPVVAACARKHGFRGIRIDTTGDPPVPEISSWILLARNPRLFEHPLFAEFKSRPLGDREVAFTDRYSNLFRVLK